MQNPLAAPPTVPTPSAPVAACAEVRARDRVMRYRRSGTGPSVLLLRDERAAADPVWPELGALLAARYRTIVPEAPADGDVVSWLDAFLEGLGTSGMALVATGAMCIPALELTLRDGEGIARLLLVTDGSADDAALAGTARLSGPVSVSLLVVRRALAAAEALPLVARFLAGEPVAPSAS